jgi:hypothetical protein
VAVIQHYQEAKKRAAINFAGTIREAVKLTWLNDGGSDCPSVDSMIARGVLDENSARRDPWGGAWRITCESGHVSVATNGPDRQAGTEDDIVVPPPVL